MPKILVIGAGAWGTALAQLVRANGAEVWYLAARDEGHGFRKKSNRDFELKTRATFLERLKE